MTSTHQLALGLSLDINTLQARWLRFNRDSGFDFLVSQNTKKPKARYFAVCDTAPTTGWKNAPPDTCRAHAKAIGKTPDEMIIKSLDLTHTCGAKVLRKRNYLTKDIAKVSELLHLYQPTSKKEGNAKQCTKMVKSATGIQLKRGQAANAVRAKTNDTMEAAIGQCAWIPSLFTACSWDDPEGTYLYEDMECLWDNHLRQFHRAHFALSCSKYFWEFGGIAMVVCDGTFTRTKNFKHTLLIAVTFDGNNQLIILAVAPVEVEDADNWVWFKERLEEDYPGIKVWMSDADKGITSNAFSLSLSQSLDEFALARCTRHLAENCEEHCKGTMNDDEKDMILNLAKSRTEETYNKRLELLRQHRGDWALHLDERKHQFVACSFLNRGYPRYGKVTSNGVENVNSALSDARDLPIVQMIEAIVEYQQEKHNERKVMSQVWLNDNKGLTECALEEDPRVGTMANTRTVQMLESVHPLHRARVSITDTEMVTGCVEVSVDVDGHVALCPCKCHEETGLVCVHVKALLMRLGSHGASKEWYDQRFHAQQCALSYGGPVPALAVAGKLSADRTLVPGDYKRPPGRPSKKRRDRSYLRKTNIKRQCKACGNLGHFAMSCPKPSTEFRVKTQHLKALQWCKKIELLDIEEDNMAEE